MEGLTMQDDPTTGTPNKMRVAIYARVSTIDKGQDTENQLAELRRYATAQGWEIKEFIDHVSGKHADRDAFQAMFTAAERREIDVVLFWSLDRFSREGVLPTLKHLERLTACGVGYRSFTEQYLDSCGMFKDAIISILATLAKQERVRISERTKAGLARAAAQGRRGGRPVHVFRRDLAQEMRSQGLSWREIGKRIGVPFATVRSALTSVQ
jgi:DNA invertase Pin-like site-specific DNA recombinase